jgi:hypothetical protein
MTDKDITRKLVDVENFFKNPENIEVIKENQAYSKKISEYISVSQENLQKELYKDLTNYIF